MITFYPGPSKIYPFIQDAITSILATDLITYNHRSNPFHLLYQETEHLFREKFYLPYGYHLFFVSSATEAWEIVGQSYAKYLFFHVYNGAFGEKWALQNRALNNLVVDISFHHQKTMSINQLKKMYLPSANSVICFTQNETSNGTQVKNGFLRKARQACPDALIAVDATSSLGGVLLDWKNADIWFASVQKCLGLPAGMALVIANERAVASANQIHYNSLHNLYKHKQHFETTHTPNILGIALLREVLKRIEPIDKIHQKTRRRADSFYKWLTSKQLKTYITNQHVRSDTVITLVGKPEVIQALKEKSLQAGIIVGNGYGKLKDNTVRIANFPAITDEELEILKKVWS